jgi:hypothetical protein
VFRKKAQRACLEMKENKIPLFLLSAIIVGYSSCKTMLELYNQSAKSKTGKLYYAVIKCKTDTSSQIEGQIFEYYLKQVTPFAEVEEIYSHQKMIADEMGEFHISLRLDSCKFKISYLGCKTLTTDAIYIEKHKKYIIYFITKYEDPPLYQAK